MVLTPVGRAFPILPREQEKLRDILRLRDVPVSNFDIDALTFEIGDGINEIPDNTKSRLYLPYGVTIYQWTIGADQSGSVQFDVWVDSHANYPPTVADTITASAKPLVSTATNGQSSALTGWMTQVKAGSWIIVNVDSCTTITKATLCLSCRKGL